tara:strand:+ start:112 stop:879 length:768 start_codon:yes stop_codon:yes gene_type:complete
MKKLPKMPSLKLNNRRALITGAYGGLGLGCSTVLADAGAHVVVSGPNEKKLKSLVETIEKNGGSAEHLELDISNVKDTQNKIDQMDYFDILVNSAGIARHSNSLKTIEDEFDEVTNINFKGAYFITQAVAKKLIKCKKPGSLINISSQMGQVGGLERAVYSASKHAVEGFTKSMAIELGKHNIRVNTICPTFILTNLTKNSYENKVIKKWIDNKIKLNRIGKVEDIMGAVLFLASDASAMITGSALMIDGGWTAG